MERQALATDLLPKNANGELVTSGGLFRRKAGQTAFVGRFAPGLLTPELIERITTGEFCNQRVVVVIENKGDKA